MIIIVFEMYKIFSFPSSIISQPLNDIIAQENNTNFSTTLSLPKVDNLSKLIKFLSIDVGFNILNDVFLLFIYNKI